MRVIICGAGQVGYSIASYLSREDNDITIIDTDQNAIHKVNESLDVNAILGHASHPDTLASAGANNADMIIAVTQSDEVNMVACQVAHSLFNVPRKIARVRQTAYLEESWANLFSRAHMPIDVIISPEYEVAKAITQRLSFPGTTNVMKMGGGQVYMCGILVNEKCPFLNTQLNQLASLFPDSSMRIVTILRKGKVIIPNKNDQMMNGDEVYFTVHRDQVDQTLDAFGRDDKKAHNIVIMGGGNIGLSLVSLIQSKDTQAEIKILEHDHDRAVKLSEDLEKVVVIHGNGLEKSILKEANVDQIQTMIAVTNDDETNILGSLLAKQQGCKSVITLVNKPTYNTLLGTLGLGAVVSPRAITVSTIMQHVRRGRIQAVHNIGDGAVEVIEAQASDTCSVINTAIKNLTLPSHTTIGAIIRHETNEVVMPTSQSVIKPNDHVIIISTREQARKVEKLFSVNVNIF